MAERRVLQVLPHSGGGSEKYVRQLELVEGFSSETTFLAQNRRALTALASVPRVRALSRDFDLVHIHGDTSSILCWPVLRLRPGVITLHGMHLMRMRCWRGPMRVVAAHRLRASMKAASVTICSSDSERAEAEKFAGSARLVTMAYGVEIPPNPSRKQRRRARAELGVRDSDFVVLFAAELSPHKDPLTFVRGIERARARGAPVVGIVAGEGSLRTQLEANEGAIRILGQRDDIPWLMAGADAFANTSHHEGLSIAVLEALSTGLVPVVSNGAGNPDAVGDTGLVFPFGDADAFADALIRVASDRDLAASLGSRARDRAERLYDERRMLVDVRKVYEQAVAGR
jgi:glycosyltransferase involved in cell wall biosynthesis